jgi:hypothetical protein
MTDFEINSITILAMRLYPYSKNTEEAVLRLLCDVPIAYANEVDLLRTPNTHQVDLRVTIASALKAAQENVFARIDAIENQA